MTGYQPESGERQNALRRKPATEAGPDTHSPVHPLLTLQSQIGNAQVARLLAQRAEDDEMQAKHDLSVQRADDDEMQAKHDLSVQRAEDDEMQAKHDLSVQRADDDEMQAKHDLSVQRAEDDEMQAKQDLSVQRADDDEMQAKHDLSVQRADDDEMQAKHDLAQRDEDMEQVGIEGGAVGPDTAQRIASARGSGSTLDGGMKSQMEAGFGTSFEDVRVHQDSESNTLNQRLTSHAFTTGSDIFLRGDASASDGTLMAHELTHVVQQRSMSGGGGMSVGSASDAHESHADAMASSILSGGSAPATAAPGAQRETDDETMAMHDLTAQRASDEDENT